MGDTVVVSVGTKRGLFLLKSDRRRAKWKLSGPFIKGWSVYHAVVDTRGTPTVHAAACVDAFSTTTYAGDINGRKFAGAKKPPIPPKLLPKPEAFAKKYGIAVHPRVWHIEPARKSEPGVLYAGTAPAGLFRSENSGKTWQPVESLIKHPSRKDWMPGAGGMCLHSIQVDPANPKRMYVAISAAGAFRTDDGAKTWKPINKAVAKFIGAPENNEVGTCVHKLLLHTAVPGRIYQRNHVGVYRSDDYGDTWYAIHKDLPTDFGFGMALDAQDPDTCFVTPLVPEGGFYRATQGRFGVYRLAGRSWTALEKGLPTEGAYLNVLREGMSADGLKPCGLYVGTGTGHLFHSADAGRSWKTMAAFLPPILSVSAAVV